MERDAVIRVVSAKKYNNKMLQMGIHARYVQLTIRKYNFTALYDLAKNTYYIPEHSAVDFILSQDKEVI